jgi:hypothetical protein
MKGKSKILFLLLVVGGLYMYSKKTVSNNALTLSTSQQRNAIIIWWQTYTQWMVQADDGGRFIDIINNISGNEIDIIYNYIFNYKIKGLEPTTGTPLASQIELIKTEYGILN